MNIKGRHRDKGEVKSDLVPLGCSSPMALYLMWVMLPLLISTSTSSSSSRGVRKALVGMASVYLLYLPCQFLQPLTLSEYKVQESSPVFNPTNLLYGT